METCFDEPTGLGGSKRASWWMFGIWGVFKSHVVRSFRVEGNLGSKGHVVRSVQGSLGILAAWNSAVSKTTRTERLGETSSPCCRRYVVSRISFKRT